MQHVKKLKLHNFRKFKEFDVDFGSEINTIIGDNESGKSSILQALDLVASGNKSRVEAIGIESLLNVDAVTDFFESGPSFENLPELHVEVYLSEDVNPDLFGKYNTEGVSSAGLHMICLPNEDLAGEIGEVLSEVEGNFPYEYYVVKFVTFSGEAYSGYRRFLKCLTLDSAQISSEYANREYIRSVYGSVVDSVQRMRLSNEYRQNKRRFREDHLKDASVDLSGHDFALRTGSKFNLDSDITLVQDEIPIDQRGRGRQCFIKTEFALFGASEKRSIDTLLLEEPENHLSHVNMRKLVSKISSSHESQIIIATHSSLISSRLDLRNSILISGSSDAPISMSDVSESTAKFFMKAPDNNVLEFVLSNRVILVEGAAEYMLMAAFYSIETGASLDEHGVHVISVGGVSFKRYMELAKNLGTKVAVIRDNDGDYQSNCVDGYSEYVSDHIRVFSDTDPDRYTFEVCVYQDNQPVCDGLFSGGSIRKAPLEYMLDNKSEAAYRLLDRLDGDLEIPEYIRQAIQWISE